MGEGDHCEGEDEEKCVSQICGVKDYHCDRCA